MKQLNFNNYRNELTENDIDEIVELFTYRCQIKTVRQIRINLELFRNEIPHYGILERVIKENHGWTYCAGQSYPDEIRTVRNIFKKLK